MELKKGSKCPKCGSKDTFLKYINRATGQPYEHKIIGKCNDKNCDYDMKRNSINKYYLHDLMTANGRWSSLDFSHHNDRYESLQISDFWKAKSNKSNLVSFLESMFNKNDVRTSVEKYKITSPSFENRSNIFWYYSENNKLLEGKLAFIDTKTGKNTLSQAEDSMVLISKLAHSENKKKYSERKVLYGIHLLQDNIDKQICIVEQEITAIIGSIVFPEHLWLATGNQELNFDLFKPIIGKDVILFPSAKKTYKWMRNAIKFSFKCSTFLEQNYHYSNADLTCYFRKKILG